MPLVSDPGHRLVTLCLRHQIPVVPIPGPSALLASLSASGLPNEEFLFVGFLPARSGERRRALERLRIEDRTIILYRSSAPSRGVCCRRAGGSRQSQRVHRARSDEAARRVPPWQTFRTLHFLDERPARGESQS